MTEEQLCKEDAVKRLLAVAERWQNELPRRSFAGIISKLEEEVDELVSAGGGLDDLNEAGDVLVVAMFFVANLPAEKLEFLVEVAEMKAWRRLGDGGVKDKAWEADYMDTLANRLGIK